MAIGFDLFGLASNPWVYAATIFFLSFGIGGETHGAVKMAVTSPAEVLDENHIQPDQKDCVVVGGSLVTAAALKKAQSFCLTERAQQILAVLQTCATSKV